MVYLNLSNFFFLLFQIYSKLFLFLFLILGGKYIIYELFSSADTFFFCFLPNFYYYFYLPSIRTLV